MSSNNIRSNIRRNTFIRYSKQLGVAKKQTIQALLSKLVIIDINSNDIDLLQAYADIDSYSKNKLPGNPLGKSITLGKNDLWIAATAKVANAILLTVDGDFDHLNGNLLQ